MNVVAAASLAGRRSTVPGSLGAMRRAVADTLRPQLESLQ